MILSLSSKTRVPTAKSAQDTRKSGASDMLDTDLASPGAYDEG